MKANEEACAYVGARVHVCALLRSVNPVIYRSGCAAVCVSAQNAFSSLLNIIEAGKETQLLTDHTGGGERAREGKGGERGRGRERERRKGGRESGRERAS